MRKNASPGRGFGRNRLKRKQSSDIPPLNQQQLLEAVRQALKIQDEELRFSELDQLISRHGSAIDREAWDAAIPVITGLLLIGGKTLPQQLIEKIEKQSWEVL